MSTVYQWFTDRAELATEQARQSSNIRQKGMYLAEADNWVKRARMLTVEEVSKLVEGVILWRVIQECDARLKGRVMV